jgi:hypothetical protein
MTSNPCAFNSALFCDIANVSEGESAAKRSETKLINFICLQIIKMQCKGSFYFAK